MTSVVDPELSKIKPQRRRQILLLIAATLANAFDTRARRWLSDRLRPRLRRDPAERAAP